MTEHTSGNWVFVPRDRDFGGYVIQLAGADPGHCIGIVPVNRRPKEEVEANARMFAAGPTMLKALMAASHALKSYQHGNSAPDLACVIVAAVDDAIAKATVKRPAMHGDDRKLCPRCGSPDPARHPAVQFEGEVHLCEHPFHGARKAESEPTISPEQP